MLKTSWGKQAVPSPASPSHGNRAKGYPVLSSRKPREPLRRPGGALLR